MSFEIIRRKEGETSQKQEIKHEKTQVSYNDFGHLCIREFDSEKHETECAIGRDNCDKGDHVCWSMAGYKCEHHRTVRADAEHLVVFDTKTSRQIISFIAKLFGSGNGLPY
jgi:hypothetical protein